MQFSYRLHNFQTIQVKNNVVLAKCTCCPNPRWAVFIATQRNLFFKYHGNDEQHARKLFSFLAYKQVKEIQAQ